MTKPSTAPAAQTGQAPAIPTEKNIVDNVLAKVTLFRETGELQIPEGYVPENALKSAYLILSELKDKDGKPALQVCSKESIANSLLEMVVLGLSPMKKQVAFIVYGGKLTLQKEYFGTIALAKRFGNVKEVNANVVYKGDEFEYVIDPSTGRKTVTKHVQKLENIDENNIAGAYAVVIFEDGSTNSDIMTMPQIRKSWMQGYAKGESPAHKNFTGEMAKKTVVTRACKPYINSSDDEDVYQEPESKPISQSSQLQRPTVKFDNAQEANVITSPELPAGSMPQNNEFDSQKGDGLTDADRAAINATASPQQQPLF